MIIAREENEEDTEKQLLYKILFELRSDFKDLKELVFSILKNDSGKIELTENNSDLITKMFEAEGQDEPQSTLSGPSDLTTTFQIPSKPSIVQHTLPIQDYVEVNESLKLSDKEKELIIKALKKHQNKRKYAAKDLGISERTLYRKIKEYDIN